LEAYKSIEYQLLEEAPAVLNNLIGVEIRGGGEPIIFFYLYSKVEDVISNSRFRILSKRITRYNSQYQEI
jgi:hypothetical protein